MKKNDFNRPQSVGSETSSKSISKKDKKAAKDEGQSPTVSPRQNIRIKNPKMKSRQLKIESVRRSQQKSSSPTKVLIEQMGNRICVFDVNRVLFWTAENIRKYRLYVDKNFDNTEALINLMIFDKQIQDLSLNHKLVHNIRMNDRNFAQAIDTMKDSFRNSQSKYQSQVKKESPVRRS